MNTIEKFKDEYEFLSNFYPSSIDYDGITYTTKTTRKIPHT